MTSQALGAHCAACGSPVVGVDSSRGVRCDACFDRYLRSVDAGFLDHYAEFGVRARQVVAETCMRALVLASPPDRKLLGMQIYEQFVGAASDLIALVDALKQRRFRPIARTFLEFRLDRFTAVRFFGGLTSTGAIEWLQETGLPAPERPLPGLPKHIRKDVVRSLREAVADFERLRGYREIGERALALASDHFRAGVTLAGSTGWVAGRELSGAQVASIAMDARRGRLDIAALRIDEERLEQVIDAIDVMTRMARNLTYAFVTLHEDGEFTEGFARDLEVSA